MSNTIQKCLLRSSTIVLGMLFALFIACEDVPDFDQDEAVPVVEAFLYAREPVNDLVITEIIPFDADEEQVYVDGLTIDLIWKNQRFTMIPKSGSPGHYEYTGSDLPVLSGETYGLEFDFEGRRISATTQVPFPPENAALSSDSVTLPVLDNFREYRDFLDNNDVATTVDWSNPAGANFFLVIENIEENPEEINQTSVGDSVNFEFISTPTQENFFTLQPLVHYTQFGTHRIVLYSVNEEYALLYETLIQDSRNLNEPYTNISNGAGIFSACASDTLYLKVVKE